jgi:hypothetical protein
MAMIRFNNTLAPALRKADGSSELTIEAISKLDDAIRASGDDSDKYTLIITEGDQQSP